MKWNVSGHVSSGITENELELCKRLALLNIFSLGTI